MSVLSRVLALPTWIIVRITMIFLSEDHLLKRKDPGLSDWTQDRTYAAACFDVVLWIWLVILTFMFN